MFFRHKPTNLPSAAEALPGRAEEMSIEPNHFVNGELLKGPYPEGAETIYFGLGCFWGAERLFWQLPGVIVTAVGYQGGHTPNPTYEEACSGLTGHTEAVKVVYHPKIIGLDTLLKTFWEEHDPTQGMRQGNDMGTQYRSAIYTTTPQQAEIVEKSRATYGEALKAKGLGPITTEIGPAGPFYYAETYHQQYLAKNPNGYCGLAGTGVSCPIGLGVAAQ
ncbi:peptide-methionine (S)-S-oxide reductase MsrA [Devosia sp. YIM 151766]|uniref:peptide-methionine (S)-S-oxide reductase MsrA n=1 Tax=Devosia sp. YIM 151766 TaxID=3017325 RepID=UPI00255C79BB|nr:peptide-methionine (S)-S-oxide reductase MsrA [Devosia sp. YIM 151766]WIY52132.1 peptide-methionine (S)-S-oxide reductase MsrA [Devosia sp. YIM 151766]